MTTSTTAGSAINRNISKLEVDLNEGMHLECKESSFTMLMHCGCCTSLYFLLGGLHHATHSGRLWPLIVANIVDAACGQCIDQNA